MLDSPTYASALLPHLLIFQPTTSTTKIQKGTCTNSTLLTVTKENLEKLSQIGERLLKKPVSQINLEDGLFEPVGNGETNEDALKR